MANFDAQLRAWEDHMLDRYLDDDDLDDEEEIPEECRGCTPGPKCFRCGYWG